MEIPTENQIREENPHFGPVIRTVEPISPYQSKHFDFTYKVIVGAHESNIECGDGTYAIVDAWATYLWSPSRDKWCLGAN